MVALPLTVIGAYLLHTHILRPEGGALYTGQATYGDFPLHLSIITSLPGKTLPVDYSILPGCAWAIPFGQFPVHNVFDTGAAAALGGDCAQPVADGAGVCRHAPRLLRVCKRPGAAVLSATLLVFLNGGLGFLYAADMVGVPLGSAGSNQLQQVSGWTPADHPAGLVPDAGQPRGVYAVQPQVVQHHRGHVLPPRTFLAGWVGCCCPVCTCCWT